MIKSISLLLIIVVIGYFGFNYVNGMGESETIVFGGRTVEFTYIVKNDISGSIQPTIIALHGNGDTPNGFYNSVFQNFKSKARIILVKAPVSYSLVLGGTAWPYQKADIEPLNGALHMFIQKMNTQYASSKLPIVIGFSGGAATAYFLAANYPDKYSHVIAVSGKLSGDHIPVTNKYSYQNVKIVGFHGTGDKVVSFSSGNSTYNAFKAAGFKMKFESFGGGHQGIFAAQNKPILKVLNASVLD